jgi:peroxidase
VLVQVPGLLAQVYTSVDDIDLFVGLVSENASPGGALPPTLRCLTADHFSGLKFTDSFYYENTKGPYAFTTSKLLF